MELAFNAFRTLAPNEVKAAVLAGLDCITLKGQHPGELPRRRGVHAFPALWLPGDGALYILFANPNNIYRVLLHFAMINCERVEYPATLYVQRPPLPREAWNIATERLDAEGW